MIPNPREFLATALTDVCLGDEADRPLADTLARYFHPEYRQTSDGRELDYAAFLAHVRTVRGRVRSGRFDILDVVADGDRIADRHRVRLRTTSGGEILAEVFLFGRFAQDGRLIRVHETTRLLVGGEHDTDIAYAVE
jgi:hypothetical protein